jgi:hypothetical protein
VKPYDDAIHPTSSRRVMTNSLTARHYRTIGRLLAGLLAIVLAGSACAWQATPPPIKPAKPILIAPPPEVRFQQVVQQQKALDQLQQSQLEQQLHRDVSTNAQRPTSAAAKAQQHGQAEQAQLERDRARQQDLMDQYRLTPVLPRVVPKDLPAPDQDNSNR